MCAESDALVARTSGGDVVDRLCDGVRQVIVVMAACTAPLLATTPCFHLAECNGHGICDPIARSCTCYDGWGGPNDLAQYKAPDCSKRTWAAAPDPSLSPSSR